MDSCVICKKGFRNDEVVTVTEKGMLNLIIFRKECGHLLLNSHLCECISKKPIGQVLVHKNCRQEYTNPKRATSLRDIEDEPLQTKRLCSSMSSFSLKENCMLCGEKAKIDARYPERKKIHNVTALTMHDDILECCDRRGDTWVQKKFVWLLGPSCSRGNLPCKLLFIVFA